MSKAIDYKIYGIKCDHCDWKDMSVTVEDYDKWLNKSCPICGTNLLTKADYKNTKRLIKFVKLMNKILPESKDGAEKTSILVDMNGTGKMNFKVKDKE